MAAAKEIAYNPNAMNTLVAAAVATATQSGNAAPDNTNVIVIPGTAGRSVHNQFALQFDVAGTGSFTALVVNILASLDGISFYVVATYNNTTGHCESLSGFGFKCMGVSVTTYTAASGAPSISVYML